MAGFRPTLKNGSAPSSRSGASCITGAGGITARREHPGQRSPLRDRLPRS